MNALYREFSSTGFDVLAFPCNNFGKVRMMTEWFGLRIAKFCALKGEEKFKATENVLFIFTSYLFAYDDVLLMPF